MSGEAINPALVFATADKEKAQAFCRELVRRGLTHQRKFARCSPVPVNTFRTSYRPAARKLAARYRVVFVDGTAAPRVERPPRRGGGKWTVQPPGPCANAVTGCERARVYSDGYCKRCHDRHAYRTDPVLRERKIRQSMERVARIRAAARAVEGK